MNEAFSSKTQFIRGNCLEANVPKLPQINKSEYIGGKVQFLKKLIFQFKPSFLRWMIKKDSLNYFNEVILFAFNSFV